MVVFVFWRFADVLAKREAEFRVELFQVSADFAKSVALIIRQRVHRIENQRPHSRAKLAPRKLPVEMKQNGIQN